MGFLAHQKGLPNMMTTRGRSSTSAAAIAAGNDDVLIEILLYLPTKTLIRFKSVSKRWLSLISSSCFSHLHSLRHRPAAASALCLRKSSSYFYILPLFTKPQKLQTFKFNLNSDIVSRPAAAACKTKILQSCSGLLLLQASHNTPNAPVDYYIYNPATHQFRLLQLDFSPDINRRIQIQRRVLGVSLAYDPSKSVDYKVLCVCTSALSVYIYQVVVYDSKIQSWKLGNGEKEFIVPYDVKFCDGVYWDGRIYWIRANGGELFHFDIDKDCIGKSVGVPLEGRWMGDKVSDTYYFGNSNGHLHFVAMYLRQASASELRVFEMEGDCSRWLLRYRVDFRDIVYEFPEVRRTEIDFRDGDTVDYAFCVLGVVRRDNGESMLVFHVPGKVVAYLFKDKNLVELADLRTLHFYRKGLLKFGCYDAYEFIETLAPV